MKKVKLGGEWVELIVSGVARGELGARVPGRKSWRRINTLYSAI